MLLSVKIKPNALQNSILMENDVIKIRIQAPARDGEANEGLIRFLADYLEVPKSAIRIVRGHSSSFKRLEIPDGCEKKIEQLKAHQ